MHPSPHSETGKTLGILLFNLGGPETLDEVRPFLYNLFSDPDIIRIKNGFLRSGLARVIAFTRQGKSRNLYRQIGGGSPLRRITDAQAHALGRLLGELGLPARTYVGMRCWNPTIDEAVGKISSDRIERLVVLPLFPQFSVTTTGSCFNHFRRLISREGIDRRTSITYIDHWYRETKYLDTMCELIRAEMEQFPDPKPENIHLLYSAHSIPARYVDEGDPYQRQTEETVKLLNERLGNLSPYTLAYQSKVGPVKWLGPPTRQILGQLGRDRVPQVLAIPISFVSDHIETLQEIDILYRDVAARAGVAHFRRAASLNLHPGFIESLADLAVRAAAAAARLA